MAIHYYCRHCGTKIGTLDGNVQVERMGFSLLSNEERKEMILPQADGNLRIQAICEVCQASFEQDPKFHEYGYLIQ
ncbi:anti-sigma-F factor Fin family protein [Heyndrickxia acidiproducens]|jgi:hypothetical protein|uniref:anti-sigma-F factor Fin family protein n=1 Tax=Heyndrickxia acidiproducens TaxID=1121084 RepID=UPI00037BCF7A|nr:anti-sigma-F factor Fin family protein [Heyndrickxia acidiproducens]